MAISAVIFFGIAVQGYRGATADPIVRRLYVAAGNYPASEPPLRIVLFSDVHVHGPDMPPQRVRRIVAQINALHPDVDIAAGDFVGNNWVGADYSISQAIAPLSGLKTKYGVYAALGNNDYFAGAAKVTSALHDAGIHVLVDQATAAGPLAIAGMDGRVFGSRAALDAARRTTYASLARNPGVKVLIAHRPDEFVSAPDWITLVLAGHTHCGQIVIPFIGPVETGSDYGRKYLCGLFRDGSKELIVTAGLGTSHLPLRIGAPADIWLITLGPPSSAR